jgi:hypothetical protein
MFPVKIRPEVVRALQEWNLKRHGRDVPMSLTYLSDPELLERLRILSLPCEDVNDTILRLINQGGSYKQ